MDLLELFVQLLHADCIADTDFIPLGPSLARSFTKDGFAFGLCYLFHKAGVRVRAGNVEREVCAAVRTAAREIKANLHTQEVISELTVRRSYSIWI